MTLRRLVWRSLRLYWRTGLVVGAAIAIASAVITGALVVGDSVRGSLRDTTLERLGSVTHAVAAPSFFRAGLARDFAAATGGTVPDASAILMLPGSVRNAATDAVVPGVNVIGADQPFWSLDSSSWAPPASPGGDADITPEAAMNRGLAADLGVRSGEDILITVGRQRAGPSEGLFARRRRRDVASTIRLTVGALLSDRGVGGFGLDAQTLPRRTVFVPRDWLARQIRREGLANVLLLAAPQASAGPAQDAQLQAALRAACALADHGLRLRPNPAGGYVSVESAGLVLTEAQVSAIRRACERLGLRPALTSVYLATRLSRPGASGTASYAVIAGAEDRGADRPVAGAAEPGPGGIVLGQWLAADLGARPGEALAVETLVATPSGDYPTRTTRLTVRGIVGMQGAGADPGLSPDFEGITNARRIGDWDPPFPVDMRRVTPRDEQYWERWRAAPKAFVSLDTARALWQTTPDSSDAWVTSVRVRPPAGMSLADMQNSLDAALLIDLTLEDSGLVLRPVRRLALAASEGSTDYAGLFLGMGLFLVAAAAGLAGMTMRLSVERRAAQAGLMLACGFEGRTVVRVLAAEGAVLSLLGAAAGVPLGVGYAALVLHLLTTRWRAAVGPTPLWLHVQAASLACGGAAGLVVGLGTLWWAARRLRREPVLRLLAGWQSVAVLAARSVARRVLVLLVLLAAAGLALAAAGRLGQTGAFFAAGAALLAAAIAACDLLLARAPSRPGVPSPARLAARNAAVHRGQSVLTVGLLAGAAFVLVTAAANTRDFARADLSRRDSGSGGFSLVVTSPAPLSYDLGTPEGRRRLGFSPEDEQAMDGSEVVSFLMSPGEDVSCLNLSRPAAPRVLGVPDAMVRRGGFAVTGAGPNPWQALNVSPAGGTIPAFGDSDSVMWTLHSGLGQVYPVTAQDGRPERLRFAGLVASSVFAGELLVSEASFRRLYPASGGPRYFLIAVPVGREAAAADALRRSLGELGADVRTTRDVLGALIGVQNTYLSTFTALGGLGLLLGTAGLAAVLARGALERRRELALLQAVGFGRPAIAGLLAAEVAGLLLAGVLAGTACALLAVRPHLVSAEARVDWTGLATLLAAVCGVGLLACAAAAWAATRGRLTDALRTE